ncbi:MAG: FTR1 family iron permease, partial [Thermobifida sp.]|nr:FTR1 family iron permease [Thermobifida sp.]
EAYYKHYEITGMEKQVMARISGSRVSQVEMEFSLLKKAMSDADSAGVDSHATTLKQYMVEDGASLDGVAPGSAAQASSDDYSPGAWGEVAKTINGILEDGANAYKGGDAKAGKDKVNEAYYKHYEITGMEKQVMSRISGSRVSQVEMEFSLLKKAMTDDDSAAVDQHLSTLTNYIREDANSLDGYTGKAADKTTDSSGTSPWIAQFLPSLLVILREGMEAILVVAAVLAYLAKAGHKNKAPIVWGGVALALALSVGLAFLFSYVTSLAGANQELLEGFAALFAVVMLIWVSNWMINKSSNKAWDEYIKKQTDASLTSGSLLGLAFISFLAVLREGAETMLFYVPIVAAAGDKVHYVWIGLAVGLVALVIIYLLIQFAAVRIPLRPFFTITSLLMAFMAFTFTGSGIGELQEADVVSLTPISGFPTIDLLGIYPRVENLAAQAIVLAIIVGLYFFGKARLAREAAAQSRAGE